MGAPSSWSRPASGGAGRVLASSARRREQEAQLTPIPVPRAILLVSSATGYGGAERSIELLAPELARRTRVAVMTCNERHRRNLLAAAVRAGVELPVWSLPADEGRRGMAEALLRFAAAHAWLRPAVIVANTEHSARVAAWAGRLWAPAAPRTWIYVRDFTWRWLGRVLSMLPQAGVLVPGPAVLERTSYLAPWVEPLGPRRLRIVPDMVELPASSVAEAARDGEGYVLHLATVNGFKGHAHLIRAAQALRDDGHRIWVRSRGVTGSLALRGALERQLAEAGLAGAGSFELLEHAEDPTPELRHCRAVVVTSVSHSNGPETFGRTIIEAWAHEKPVVAFAAGGPRHLIEDGEDGLLVPEGDEAALARALWRLHVEPGLAERLGARGLDKVRRHYGVVGVVDQLLRVFAEPRPEPGARPLPPGRAVIVPSAATLSAPPARATG